jgi:hypothetical protein
MGLKEMGLRQMGRPIRQIGKLISTFLSVYYAYMVEYRAELILWVLAGSLPLILMGVWMQAAQGQGFLGFTSVQFARYFLAVFVIRQFTVVWVVWEFEKDVVDYSRLTRFGTMLLPTLGSALPACPFRFYWWVYFSCFTPSLSGYRVLRKLACF